MTNAVLTNDEFHYISKYLVSFVSQLSCIACQD